jgi:hypothetical protein
MVVRGLVAALALISFSAVAQDAAVLVVKKRVPVGILA